MGHRKKQLHKLLNMASGDNIYNNSSYVAQPDYWCPSQYASPFPNQSIWQGTLRSETWSEQEAIYLIRRQAVLKRAIAHRQPARPREKETLGARQKRKFYSTSVGSIKAD